MFAWKVAATVADVTEFNEFDPGGTLPADKATEVVLQYRALKETGRRLSGPEAVEWYEKQRVMRESVQAG